MKLAFLFVFFFLSSHVAIGQPSFSGELTKICGYFRFLTDMNLAPKPRMKFIKSLDGKYSWSSTGTKPFDQSSIDRAASLFFRGLDMGYGTDIFAYDNSVTKADSEMLLRLSDRSGLTVEDSVVAVGAFVNVMDALSVRAGNGIVSKRAGGGYHTQDA